MSLLALACLLCLPATTAFSWRDNWPCPKPTINYNNESCYVFIDYVDIKYLVWDVWKRDPGRRRSSLYTTNKHYLDSCIWDKKEAESVCNFMSIAHKFVDRDYTFERYKALKDVEFHLPIIETEEEDDWLVGELGTLEYRHRMGTNFWIDLILVPHVGYVWQTTNAFSGFYRHPDGIDRLWLDANITLFSTKDDEPTCHELHLNYYSHRRPTMPIIVRGWHARACSKAYEKLFHIDQFEDNLDLITYWGPINTYDKMVYSIDEYFKWPLTNDFRCGSAYLHTSYYKDKYAPTGVICETDISNFLPKENVTENQ